jgi:hypothetical protein
VQPSTTAPDKLCFPAKVWKAVRALALLEPQTFKQLPSDIEQNLHEWCTALAKRDAAFAAALDLPPPQPESPPPPNKVPTIPDENDGPESLCSTFPRFWGSHEISRFNQLLLLRAVQPSQLLDGLRKFVTLTLGKSSIALQLTLREIYVYSECRMPVIIVLAQGVDPAAELADIAELTLGSSQHMRTVSLGRGQEEKAFQVIDDCIQKGHWALLQNCHLARSWLPSLDRHIARVLANKNSEVHEHFRLFLANSGITNADISVARLHKGYLRTAKGHPCKFLADSGSGFR